MDLSQVPRGPIGTKDDPLADPYDDPSYAFQIRTPEYNRREDADSTGRVRGLYSFIDDVGEKHTVRYAAGAGTGYEVLNSVPDSIFNVRYNAPLYKAPRKTRGRVAYERGPAGQYRFVSSSPDQRRSESIGSDGITRGSYSFLDDKGVQRTVEYIAGAGIGYRIVKTTVGPLTHILPAPVIPEFGLRGPLSNDIAQSDSRNRVDDSNLSTAASGRPFKPPRGRGNNSPDDDEGNDDGGTEPNQEGGNDNKIDGPDYPRRRPAQRIRPNGNRAFRGRRPQGNNDDDSNGDVTTKTPPKYLPRGRPTPGTTGNDNSSGQKPGSDGADDDDLTPPPRGPDGQRVNDDDGYGSGIPSVAFDGKKEDKDTTLIKNVGDWYVGLPPGAVVRAHVQSIDLLPYGARAPSPAEALKRESEGL